MAFKHVYRHLTDDGLVGDGTNNNANVNGVSVAVPFWAGPAVGKIWEIERLIVLIEDNSQVTADSYGGIATLANGVGISAGDELDLLDGANISSTAEWSGHCHDVSVFTFGSGNNYISVRWTFGKSGEPLILHGTHRDAVVATINDDLSTLVAHTFVIQGIEHS